MCLGIPGRVTRVFERGLRFGVVAFGGVTKEICLVYVPEADVGDYVVVHAGFAISRIDEGAAQRALSYIHALDGADEVGS